MKSSRSGKLNLGWDAPDKETRDAFDVLLESMRKPGQEKKEIKSEVSAPPKAPAVATNASKLLKTLEAEAAEAAAKEMEAQLKALAERKTESAKPKEVKADSLISLVKSGASKEQIIQLIENQKKLNPKFNMNAVEEGYTALQYAVLEARDVEIIKALLEQGADANQLVASDKSKLTLLELAVRNSSEEVILLLLEQFPMQVTSRFASLIGGNMYVVDKKSMLDILNVAYNQMQDLCSGKEFKKNPETFFKHLHDLYVSKYRAPGLLTLVDQIVTPLKLQKKEFGKLFDTAKRYHAEIVAQLLLTNDGSSYEKLLELARSNSKKFLLVAEVMVNHFSSKTPTKRSDMLIYILQEASKIEAIRDEALMLKGRMQHDSYVNTHNEMLLAKAALIFMSIENVEKLAAKDNVLLGQILLLARSVGSPYSHAFSFYDSKARELKILRSLDCAVKSDDREISKQASAMQSQLVNERTKHLAFTTAQVVDDGLARLTAKLDYQVAKIEDEGRLLPASWNQFDDFMFDMHKALVLDGTYGQESEEPFTVFKQLVDLKLKAEQAIDQTVRLQYVKELQVLAKTIQIFNREDFAALKRILALQVEKIEALAKNEVKVVAKDKADEKKSEIPYMYEFQKLLPKNPKYVAHQAKLYKLGGEFADAKQDAHERLAIAARINIELEALSIILIEESGNKELMTAYRNVTTFVSTLEKTCLAEITTVSDTAGLGLSAILATPSAPKDKLKAILSDYSKWLVANAEMFKPESGAFRFYKQIEGYIKAAGEQTGVSRLRMLESLAKDLKIARELGASTKTFTFFAASATKGLPAILDSMDKTVLAMIAELKPSKTLSI